MNGRLHEIIAREIDAGLQEEAFAADDITRNIIRALDAELLAPALRQALLDCNVDAFDLEPENEGDPVQTAIEGNVSLPALAKRLVEVLNAEPTEAPASDDSERTD